MHRVLLLDRVLLLGAGKIGRTIARLLTDSGDYEVLVADADPKALDRLTGRSKVVDATDRTQLKELRFGHLGPQLSAESFDCRGGAPVGHELF